MHSHHPRPLSRQISSEIAVWVKSVVAGLLVFAFAIFLQWLVYDDWMHDSGPLRVVGSVLAGGLMCGVVAWRQFAARQSKLDILRRFETIRWMNDRIRNALQAIECVTFAAAPEATHEVRNAVDSIESVLQEVLAEAHPVSTSERRRQSMELRAQWEDQEPGTRVSGPNSETTTPEGQVIVIRDGSSESV